MTSSSKDSSKPKLPRGKPGERSGARHGRASDAEFADKGLGIAPKE